MHPSIWTLIIVALLALLVFGRPGKLSGLMEDMGKGIRGFRKGLSDKDDAVDEPASPSAQVTAEKTREKDKTGA